MKKTPGPRAPPARSRPSRNITARSYSWTVSKLILLKIAKQMASYLDHFDNEEKGERKSGDNHEEGGDGQKVSTNAWSLFAHLPLLLLPRGRTIVPVHCWDCALAGLLLGTGGEVVSWDPPSRILGSWNWDPRILHPQGIRGGGQFKPPLRQKFGRIRNMKSSLQWERRQRRGRIYSSNGQKFVVTRKKLTSLQLFGLLAGIKHIWVRLPPSICLLW